MGTDWTFHVAFRNNVVGWPLFQIGPTRRPICGSRLQFGSEAGLWSLSPPSSSHSLAPPSRLRDHLLIQCFGRQAILHYPFEVNSDSSWNPTDLQQTFWLPYRPKNQAWHFHFGSARGFDRRFCTGYLDRAKSRGA